MRSLLETNRVWSEAEVDEGLLSQVRKELNCSIVFAKVLLNRYGEDVKRISSARSFQETSFEEFSHPSYQLSDMKKATERTVRAIEEGEDIFLHGDFDVDGLSSCAIVYRGLRTLQHPESSGKLKVDVGNRNAGHGITRKVSSRLIEEDYDLLITTDCGIKDEREIKHLADFGIDVVVTDHHEPPDSLPPAFAVINPKRDGSAYPNPNLSGAGVAYKLISALFDEIRGEDKRGDLLQLAALGTVSDVVPLVVGGEDENRLLVKAGLEEMNTNPITGISALLGELNCRKSRIDAETISYKIAPKLNSANRVGDPQASFLLLSTGCRNTARHLADTLIDYDRDRSRLQKKLVRSAISQLKDRNFDSAVEDLVFVIGEDWNPGIIGLISSRLSEKFDLPAVTISKTENRCRGSVRGVEGLSVVDGLRCCSENLIKFGGHEMAGGFLARPSDLDSLRSCLKRWASSREKKEGAKEKHFLDARLTPDDASLNLCHELESLSPFGEGNPRPKFWMEGLDLVSARRVGRSKGHLKIKVSDHGCVLDCIGFGMGKYMPALKKQEEVNPVFTLDVNEWKGKRGVQLKLKDFIS